VYDPRNVSARLSTVKVETSTPASLMPFYDDDLAILFLGGKGEGSIEPSLCSRSSHLRRLFSLSLSFLTDTTFATTNSRKTHLSFTSSTSSRRTSRRAALPPCPSGRRLPGFFCFFFFCRTHDCIRTCNTAKCETFRFLKLTTNAVIPVHFEVPRQVRYLSSLSSLMVTTSCVFYRLSRSIWP
jgi:hypothetical protein